MTTKSRFVLALTAATSVFALAGAAFGDPPGRVGRVSDAEGWTSFLPVGEDFWSPTPRNLPVTSGESFWNDDGARLELQVAGVEARLDQQSELDIVDLDYGVTRLALPQGSLDLRVWRAPRGGIVIVTPAGEVRIFQPGTYRIDAQPAAGEGDYGPGEVTVFEGEAFAPAGDDFLPIAAGQSATFLPGYDLDLEYADTTGIDQWARARDAREAQARRDNQWAEFTGAADLEGQGDWSSDPQYGQVWYPRVGADWAPYRYGRWSYVEPWGWTWIDDQPWGFAPFHYGRWAQVGGRWGWVPGQREAEPVYAPALVAFVGGGGWGASIGVGEARGWVPLAPDEVYRPTYRVSDAYVRRVNIANVDTTIYNTTVVNKTTVANRVVYRNVQAATVVPAASFGRGAPVQGAVLKVDVRAVASAPPATMQAITPTREARGGGQPAAGSRPPGAAPGGATAANPPHPPARLQAVRAAVAAPAPAGGAPAHPAMALKPAAPAPSVAGGKPLQKHVGAPGAGPPHVTGAAAGTAPPRPVPPPTAPNAAPSRPTPPQPSAPPAERPRPPMTETPHAPPPEAKTRPAPSMAPAHPAPTEAPPPPRRTPDRSTPPPQPVAPPKAPPPSPPKAAPPARPAPKPDDAHPKKKPEADTPKA